MLQWRSLIVLMLINLPMGQASPLKRSLTLQQVRQILAPADPQALPSRLAQLTLQDVRVDENQMSFKVKGVRFHMEILPGQPYALSVNGQLFTAAELKNQRVAYQGLRKKFALERRAVSLLDFILPAVFAQSVVDPTGGNSVQPGPSGGTSSAANTSPATTAGDSESLERRFHSYDFAGAGPVQNRFSNLGELRDFLKENDVTEVLGVAASLMAALGSFSASNPIFNQMMDLGVPAGQTPAAPAFSSSWRSTT
jgi:hypothetical protein